ncbi:CHAT domain-containing protein [Cytophaga sp. FL35]|uniref:CHAT domain-containing protein n=1 Tax=Cytophaga sp. FL35 TaxID=1904456 RepID=UPI001653E3E1|nr:CHAT domain-containing protein [Cytophaga sp. FL35]MBC6997399.1 CHAT domain-containing protein [Cytophaga sp. FL35]
MWSQTVDMQGAFDKGLQYHYTDKDSAYFYYEKALVYAREEKDIEAQVLVFSYLLNANSNFYDLVSYGKNISKAEHLINTTPQLDTVYMGPYFKQNLLFEKGAYHYKLKDYSTAERYFYEYYSLLKNFPVESLTTVEIDMMSAIFSYLGLTHHHMAKYEEAEFYFKKDLQWITTYQDSIPEWESVSFNTKKLLSQTYEAKGRLAAANSLLVEAVDFYAGKVNNPRHKNNYLSSLILLAENLLEQKDYKEAISILNKGLADFKAENTFQKEMFAVLGDAYLGMKDFDYAESYYDKSLKAYKAYRENKTHKDIATGYGKLARLSLEKGQFSRALEMVGFAFANSGLEVTSTSYDINPDPNKVFSKSQLLDLLEIKLRALEGLFKKSNKPDFLQSLLQTNKDLLQTFQLLKMEFESKADKQFLTEKAYPIFERMLATTFLAYQENGSDEILQLALDITEANKDFILLEALRNARATKFGGMPKEILEKESQLRADISQLEKNQFETGTSQKFSNQLFNAKERYYSFLDSLKTAYPKYHSLKYGAEPILLTELKKEIRKEDQAIISYTVVKDVLYVLVFSSAETQFLKIPFSSSEREKVSRLYKLISQPGLGQEQKEIKQLASLLYEQLLSDVLNPLKMNNLTIIRDDILHYLPFDLLISDGQYLLETKNIVYANSITSWAEIKNHPSVEENKLLAIAPTFNSLGKEEERQFGQLLYNDDEIRAIKAHFPLDSLMAENATLKNFRERVANYRMLHLATHASANDAYPDYSYLAFSENNKSENNVLYIRDLYETNLKAELVTLSACQTGIGSLQTGQGMLSLSKGFQYAGAKALVHTQWKINDKSSVQLMDSFYKFLSEGATKSEALRKAKLTYLQNTDDSLLKHPYYWAAYAVSGNNSPVSTDNSFWYLAMLLVLVSIFSIWLWMKKKRRGGLKSV